MSESRWVAEEILDGGLSPKDALKKAKAADAAKTGQYPMVKLGTILGHMPDEVTQQLIDVLNNVPDTIDAARQLKAILHPHAATLEEIGILPDYLAYMLIAAADQARGS